MARIVTVSYRERHLGDSEDTQYTAQFAWPAADGITGREPTEMEAHERALLRVRRAHPEAVCLYAHTEHLSEL